MSDDTATVERLRRQCYCHEVEVHGAPLCAPCSAADLIEQQSQTIAEQARTIAELREELERERMRLAACGVAALCNTQESMEKQLIPCGSQYWSASYGDVLRLVKSEMKQRETIAEQATRLAECERELELKRG